MSHATEYTPPLLRPLKALKGLGNAPKSGTAKAGHMAFFFIRSLASIPLTLKHYPKEVWRLLSDVTWGNGSIIVGGGTIGVIIVLSAFGGITVGMEAFTDLDLLGLGPITGGVSAFATTRELGPLLAALAFAAQAGCRFTAQLGTQRISEEIDALDVIAIRPLPYLVTTRMIAAMIAIIPLYVIGLAVAYVSCRLTVQILGGTSAGTYMHYFHTFFLSQDIFWSVIKAIVFAALCTFIQCYYGFFASGGPEGVGVAAGRAIKMCFIVVVFANMFLTLAIWGITPGIRISG